MAVKVRNIIIGLSRIISACLCTKLSHLNEHSRLLLSPVSIYYMYPINSTAIIVKAILALYKEA